MQLKSKRGWLLPLLLTIISVIVIGGSLSLRFLDLDTYKAQIVAQVRSALKRDLRYASGDFSLRFGPAFTFTDVTIKEKDGVADFVKADALTIKIAIIPLLRKELVLSKMVLEHPAIELSRDRAGLFNISDLLTGPSHAGIRSVELKKARIRFSDRIFSDTPVVTELGDTDLYLSRLMRGKNCDVKLSGALLTASAKVPLFLAGAVKVPEHGAPWSSCQITGRVRTGYLDAGHFFPYYSRFVPFRSVAGLVSLEGSFRGRPSAFKSKADIKVARLDLDYPQVFHARLTPKFVKGSLEMELAEQSLDLNGVKLNVDGLGVEGSCRLSEIHSGDMRITARGTTNRFDLRQFRQYIPYGIIVKETADFIEQKVLGGFYRLEEGRLDGRVSQILHMERGQNYNILAVRAHVDDGLVNYGGGFPVVSAIKGELLLAGKDFILKGMNARFGSSPMALEGRIADYPLTVPCRYLFTAELKPRQPEAAWLIGRQNGAKLALSDGSTLKLVGDGTTALYNLSGSWDLANAGYSYRDLIAKPQGRPNTISFRGSFDKQAFRFNALTYNLAPLSFSATAQLPYRGAVSFDLRTNQFQAAEVAPFIPSVRKYHPAGRVQAQLHASGPGMDQLSWGGTVALAGASFKPSETGKTLSGMNGSLRLNGENIESSQLSVRLGNSTLNGHGSLTGFKSPVASFTFSSPSLDVADIGLPQGKQPVRAENVQGTLSYSKEKDLLQIASLSATLGRSVLQIKGTVQDLQHPQLDLSVGSPHLELEDILTLFGSSSEGGGGVTIRARIFAAEGKGLGIPFQRLRCTVLLEDHMLYLQPFDLATLEGEVTGKMKVDIGGATPHYQINCSMQRVSADKFLRACGVKKQEMTGTLSLQADLAARGESARELRRTSTGALKFKVEHGSVRRFATLSKIFSILNVSQLFRLHLPDMVSGGMPFNRITGDFSVREGIATTQNMFLDSNAINLSAVGKIDMIRDELDLNIGVQPLQTVDKVVSRIPIVGWIITGKDHSFITTYFEARGKIEDPQVTAVPVKSLAKGVFNIFKRVFELPRRLITDTGEVMLGN
jgi:hypothetical protein